MWLREEMRRRMVEVEEGVGGSVCMCFSRWAVKGIDAKVG